MKQQWTLTVFLSIQTSQERSLGRKRNFQAGKGLSTIDLAMPELITVAYLVHETTVNLFMKLMLTSELVEGFPENLKLKVKIPSCSSFQLPFPQ